MKVSEFVLYALGVLGLGALAAKALSKKDEEESPKAPSPGVPKKPGPQSVPSPMVHKTPLQNLVLAPSGFAALPGGGYVNKEPLLDTRYPGLWARVSSRDLATFAAKLGGRLLTTKELQSLWAIGYRLKPCTLDYRGPMQSLEYAKRHDACVQAQLAGWDRFKPLVSEGKTWVLDDNPDDHPGMGRNAGWFRPDGTMIQPGGSGSEHHDLDYTDYSQLGRFYLPALPNA